MPTLKVNLMRKTGSPPFHIISFLFWCWTIQIFSCGIWKKSAQKVKDNEPTKQPLSFLWLLFFREPKSQRPGSFIWLNYTFILLQLLKWTQQVCSSVLDSPLYYRHLLRKETRTEHVLCKPWLVISVQISARQRHTV